MNATFLLLLFAVAAPAQVAKPVDTDWSLEAAKADKNAAATREKLRNFEAANPDYDAATRQLQRNHAVDLLATADAGAVEARAKWETLVRGKKFADAAAQSREVTHRDLVVLAARCSLRTADEALARSLAIPENLRAATSTTVANLRQEIENFETLARLYREFAAQTELVAETNGVIEGLKTLPAAGGKK